MMEEADLSSHFKMGAGATWLRARKIFFTRAAFDYISVLLTYNLAYKVQTGEWGSQGNSGIIIGAIFVTCSYLTGRYSTDNAWNPKRRDGWAGSTLIGPAAVIVLAALYTWSFDVPDTTIRVKGFLIPVVLTSWALSIAGSRVIKGRVEKKNYIMICSPREKECIERICMNEMKDVDIRYILSLEELQVLDWNWRNQPQVVIGSDILAEETWKVQCTNWREKGVRVIGLSGWCEENIQRVPPELVCEGWVVQSDGFSLRPDTASWRAKRLLDVILGTLLLILTAPVVAIALCLVKIEDGGKVFYSQARTGLFGKEIRIWKIRSMREDAEKGLPKWAARGDVRVTRVGRIIRATRIDELPQLAGVIKGDLSLIGPRPERGEIEEVLSQEIPFYRLRHTVRPGISGWAQVSYPYGASVEDSKKKLSYDLYYLKNGGILMDILIWAKTIKLVINREGYQPQQVDPE